MKVAFLYQAVLGAGQTVAIARLARVLAKHNDVRVLAGNKNPATADFGKATFEPIEPIDQAAFGKGYVDAAGNTIAKGSEEYRQYYQRYEQGIINSLKADKPDILVISGYPSNKQPLQSFDKLLQFCGENHIKTAAIFRDIIGPGKTYDEEWFADLERIIDNHIDFAFVRGDEKIVDTTVTWPDVVDANGNIDPNLTKTWWERINASLKDKLLYMGYISDPDFSPSIIVPDRSKIIVSTGGGLLGDTLNQTAIAANCLHNPNQQEMQVLLGHRAQQTVEDMRQQHTHPLVSIDPAVHGFTAYLAEHAGLSISLSGSTLIDPMVTNTPAVASYFAKWPQFEQKMRGEAFASQNLITLVGQEKLNPQDPATLSLAIAEAQEKGAADISGYNFNGANTFATYLENWYSNSHPLQAEAAFQKQAVS